jgi:hypothetical protein
MNFLTLSLFVLPLFAFAQTQPVSRFCIARDAPSYVESENAQMTTLTREILTKNQFGLFSLVYPAQPGNGYQVHFDDDGIMHGSQFGGALWELRDGDLLIKNENGAALRAFYYDHVCNSLISDVNVGDQTVLMELAIVRPAT